MKKVWFIALLGLTLGSCDKKERQTPTFEMDTPFQLTQGQTAECSCGEVSITLLKIDDSRCPTTVDCFWAGMVTVDLDLKGTSLTLGLDTNGQVAATGSYGNYSIRLLEVNPYPQVPGELEQKDYTVTLKVTRTIR